MEHYRKALAIREKALGPEHPSVGNTYTNMVSVFKRQGDLDQARQHQGKALAIQEKALGPRHPEVGRTCGNLCLAYWRQGKREEAVAMHRKLAATQLSVERYASGVAYDAGAPTRPLAALLGSRLRGAWWQVSARRLRR